MSVAYAACLLRRYAQQQTLGQCLIKDARVCVCVFVCVCVCLCVCLKCLIKDAAANARSVPN